MDLKGEQSCLARSTLLSREAKFAEEIHSSFVIASLPPLLFF